MKNVDSIDGNFDKGDDQEEGEEVEKDMGEDRKEKARPRNQVQEQEKDMGEDKKERAKPRNQDQE